MDKSLVEYQKEFDRKTREALGSLGCAPTRDEREMLRYGMAELTALSPAEVGELAEIAYECARSQQGDETDRLAQMFFRGFALARFVTRCEEEAEVVVVCMN